MKAQKGSVTVIALIMLLFLVILGGAWTIMMTQSKTNALADEKQQQAWYAAEAGFKRAQMLITKGNPTWTNLLTAYDDIKTNNKDKFTTIDLTSGIENNNIANTTPWYAVSIVTQGTTTNLSAAPSTGTTYTITSVGQYMGERKVITRDVTFGSSSGGGGGGGGGGETVIPADGLVQAGGIVTIANSVGVTGQNGGISGTIYVKNGNTNKDEIIENRGYYSGLYGAKADYKSSKITTVVPTKIDDSAFLESTYGTFKEVTTIEGDDNASLSLTNTNALVKVNWPIRYSGNNTSGLFRHSISGVSDSFLYFYLHGETNREYWTDCPTGYTEVYTTQKIIGPSSGNPLTLIFDSDVYLNSIIEGNVRIICKGNIYFGNLKKSGNIMVVANGNVIMWGDTQEAKMFISSNGNVTFDSSGVKFVGQIQAAGNVDLTDSTYTYDTTVAKMFAMPKMVAN